MCTVIPSDVQDVHTGIPPALLVYADIPSVYSPNEPPYIIPEVSPAFPLTIHLRISPRFLQGFQLEIFSNHWFTNLFSNFSSSFLRI